MNEEWGIGMPHDECDVKPLNGVLVHFKRPY